MTERADLRGRPDDAILAAARAGERAIVTENVADYRPLAAAELRAGRRHPLLIFTSDRAFPRGHARTAGRLVAALDALLSAGEAPAGECWLQ